MRSEKSSAPDPWMPPMPLCPASASASSPISFMERGRCPAPCAPSTTKRTFSGRSFLIWASGGASPVTLEAAVTTAMRVFGLTSSAMLSGSSLPFVSGATSYPMTPARLSASSGRSTELCSRQVVTAWSPCFSVPRMARSKASVQFLVKTTRSKPYPPKREESSSLHAKTRSAAASESLCPLLPGLAQQRMAASTALKTEGALFPPVAAWSR